jgi:probable phosphoglycerate mutase
MTTIYLIRHAECKMNQEFNLIGGRSNDSPLTKDGIAQAEFLGKRLERENINFDAVYSSPAIRTIKTQEISYPYAKAIICEDLQELCQGEWTGRKRIEVYTPETLEKIRRDGWNFAPPGGESQRIVGKRVLNELNNIIKDKNNSDMIGIYTHGGSIRYLLATLDLIPKKDAWKVPIDNTSITELEYKNNKYYLKRINDSSHLIHALTSNNDETKKNILENLLATSCS